MSQIKFIALDLDGTLLDSRGEISERNLTAIRAAEEIGVLVTIATGRRFRDAMPVGVKAGLNAPLITHNGALTKFADSLKVVNAEILASETAKEILSIGNDFGADAMLSADPHGKGTLFYDNLSPNNIPLQKYVAWSRRIHGDAADDAVRHVADLAEVVDSTEIVHLSFSGTCAAMSDLALLLNESLQDRAQILATVYEAQNFTLLDVLNPAASKGFGVKNFAERHNLTAKNVMAIGDNFNDLEMLEYAGTPVLMGNAQPELLETRNYHQTLSNDESGVALAIEKFVLGENQDG